jgi:hypothetical protein
MDEAVESDDNGEETRESRHTGTISWRTYWQYFSSGRSICFLFSTFFMLILAQASTSGADFWVTFW